MDDAPQTEMQFPPVPADPKAMVQLPAREYHALIAASSNALTEWQINELNKQTPKAIIAKVKLRGGTYDYLPHSYFTRRLNHIFRHRWTFEIVEMKIFEQWKQVVVHGRLKVMLGNGIVITKDGVGGSEIKCYAKGDRQGQPMDVSDDIKAAASEAKKKAASELGIGEDVYGKVLDKLSMDSIELTEAELKDLQSWDVRIEEASTPEVMQSILGDLTKTELTRQQKKYLFNKITAKQNQLQHDTTARDIIEQLEGCNSLADYLRVKKEIEKVRDSLNDQSYRMVMDVAKATNAKFGGNTNLIPDRK